MNKFTKDEMKEKINKYYKVKYKFMALFERK